MIAEGNKVELLKNGNEIFPAMLGAIRGAEMNICFETYVYWSGEIAEEFADALCDRSKNGVDVHVLLDWYGSLRMSDELVDRMVGAGVEVERFRPLKWFNLRRANHRTHRKLLIVDGNIAFTGGVGIAQEWTGDAQDPDHWRDNHYRLSGPIVTEVQRNFFKNWQRCGHVMREEDIPKYFPEITAAGSMDAEVVAASPVDGPETIRTLFVDAVVSAKVSLDVATAYFVPGERLTEALIEAAGRGVEVRVLVCGKHIDETLVRYASRACWGELMEAGIRVFEYDKTLFHVKAITVDEQWTSVGSANFDVRSCCINDELNIIVKDETFAQQHHLLFDEDCSHAHEVTLAAWKGRPIIRRILDRLALIFRPQL